MISKKELDEVRVYLDSAENPLFFFDDDCDGVCSYLLLRKINDIGKGVIVKSSPKLDMAFVKKVKEVMPDKIFVLDKPIISQEFIDAINKPIIWVDHHPPLKRKGVKYYNPRLENDKDNRPTSYWCYQISGKNLWLATVGCIADWFVPEFAEDFKEKYPDLLLEIKDPGYIIFSTKLGKLIKYMSFLLKGKTTDVKRNINILSRIESPYEILNQTSSKGKFLFKYAEKVEKMYLKLLEKAKKEESEGKLLVFTYPDSKMSFSSDLSNELMHLFPNKIVLVGRVKKDEVIISLRSSDIEIASKLEKALKGIKGYGGGHCLHPDTLLQLNDGRIKRIKDYTKENLVIFDFNKNKQKITKGSFLNPSEIRVIYDINASPYKIKASPNHRFFRFEKNKIIECFAKDLKAGDFIAGVKKMNIKGKEVKLPNVKNLYFYKIKLEASKRLKEKRISLGFSQKEVARKLDLLSWSYVKNWENKGTSISEENMNKLLCLYGLNKKKFISKYCKSVPFYKVIKVPNKLNPDMCKLFGYLIGDGCIYRNELEFKDSDYTLLKRYKEIIKKVFGCETKIYRVKDKNCFRLRIKSSLVISFLKKIAPELFNKSRNLIVPEIIQKSNGKNLVGFIKGIFDAEGSVSHHNLSLSMVDEFFLRQLQLILLRFNIVSQIWSNKKISHLIITDFSSKSIFLRKIGFSSKRKSDLLKEMVNKDKGRIRNSTLTLLPLKYGMFLDLCKKFNISGNDLCKMGFDPGKGRYDSNISYYRFKKILNFLKDSKANKDLINYLEKMFDSDIFWCKVKTIERRKKKEIFYDLTIPNYRNFVANGLVVHNSHACGGCISKEDFSEFVENLKELL